MMKVRKRWYDILPFPMLMAYIWIVLGQVVGVIPELYLRFFGRPWLGEDAALTASRYVSFLGIWVVMLLVILIPRKNQPILRTIGPGMRGNTIGMLILGFVLGFIMNAFCIVMSIFSKDISVYFDRFSIVPVLVIFLTVFIQSSAEELVCRGYLYQRLCRRYHPVIAILGNSLLFGLLHVMNPGVTPESILDIFVTGIMMSLLVYYFDSLWCAMAVHTMWNFTQNIIFGLPNSGLVVPYSIFKLDAASARDGLFYTVNFGVEGSWGSIAVMAVGCVVLIIIGTVRHLRPEPLWQIVPAEELGEEERRSLPGILASVGAVVVLIGLMVGSVVFGVRYVSDGLQSGTVTFQDLGISDGEAFLESLGIENGDELFPPETFGKPKKAEPEQTPAAVPAETKSEEVPAAETVTETVETETVKKK